MLTYDKEAWRVSNTNGKISPAKLDPVYPEQYDRDLDGPALMHPEAAAAMSTMLQAAAEAGHPDLGIALSYRTYAMQLEKYDDFKNHGGNLAAAPGTSNHGWAVSADMNWGRAVTLAWLQRNARKYGFIADVSSENWHYTFQEGLWNGDDMTKDQLAMLRANDQFRRGVLAYDAAIDRTKDPQIPDDKSGDWVAGFKFARRAYNWPKP